MRIGFFTDTYFPQVSGVATSIKTLKTALEKQGHQVFIFTTTDRDVNRYEDWQIIRIPSVPFFAFKDRRVAYAGFREALKIAKRYHLDIIHTQTEFSLGILGKYIGHELKIPVVHTYHTQYEDYTRYIAKGRLIKPGMVKYIVRNFLAEVDGVICPSQIVLDLLNNYKIDAPKRIIPTGIELSKFERPEIQAQDLADLRAQLEILPQEVMLLSLSRVSYEKNIQAVVRALPAILAQAPQVKLVIAGDGPYLADLRSLVADLGLEEQVIMTGMVPPSDVALYYKAADFFISASTSETQGLTYIESLASGTPIIAQTNPYLAQLISAESFGRLYETEADLAATVLTALAHPVPMTEAELAEKLFEISAEHFGQTVYEFYLDLKIAYDFKKDYLTIESLPDYLAKTVYLAPVMAAKTAVKFPKAFLVKSSSSTVKILKNSVGKLNFSSFQEEALRDFNETDESEK